LNELQSKENGWLGSGMAVGEDSAQDEWNRVQCTPKVRYFHIPEEILVQRRSVVEQQPGKEPRNERDDDSND